MDNGEFTKVYADIVKEEIEAKTFLLNFKEKYPESVTSKNVNDILDELRNRKDELKQKKRGKHR